MKIFDEFIGTVKSGGLTNPYGLAAVAATGKHESGWSPKNVFGSWDDPSESGQSGTSGGALSWRGPRYEAMLAHARQDGDPTPTPREQAEYFLRENPQLIRQLQSAKSPEEAQRLMNNAWRFAGYNRPGGEAARRMATAREMAAQFAQGSGPDIGAGEDRRYTLATMNQSAEQAPHRITPLFVPGEQGSTQQTATEGNQMAQPPLPPIRPEGAPTGRNYLPAWMREDASLPADPQTGASYFDAAPGGLGGLGGMRPGVSRGAAGGSGGGGLSGRIDAFVNANAPVGFGGIVGRAMEAGREKDAIRQQVEASVRAYMAAGFTEDEAFLLATNPEAGKFVYGVGKDRAEQQATQNWIASMPGSAPAAPPAPPSGYGPVPGGSVDEGPILEAPGQQEEMPAGNLTDPRRYASVTPDMGPALRSPGAEASDRYLTSPAPFDRLRPDGSTAPGRDGMMADARGRLGQELREQQADGVNRLDPANAGQGPVLDPVESASTPSANIEMVETRQQPVQLSQIEARPEQGSGNEAPTVQIETGNRTVDALMRKRAELVDWLASAPLNETASKLVERQKLQLEQIDKGLDKYDPTGAMREYQFAMQQRQDMGQPPVTFDQWENERRRAGATNISIDNAGSNDFYKEADKNRAKSFVDMADAGGKASRALVQIDTLEQLLTRSGSGGWAAVRQMAGDWGIETEGLSDIQAATALINQMVPAQRPPGSGQMSDADLALFKTSLPRIINQPGGNKIIIATMRGIAQYDQQIGAIANQVLNREINPAEGQRLMMQVPNPLANLDELLNPPADGAEAPPVQSNDGWIERDGTRIRRTQ